MFSELVDRNQFVDVHIRKFQRANKRRILNDLEEDQVKIKDPAGITMWTSLT
jgi:hypothetical protein